ncbi:DUF6146 family protein [Psychroflexus aestuariivivens]|uniref:DUF6146 family protein n=1 Tax=Psychroflexus aestuariivivens TaxID=1795040 RepID=UPI000FD9F885|nr:DUF6146 family protein [Psychroflexus aestuariivivens]
MKFIYIIILAVLLHSCSATKENSNENSSISKSAEDTIRIANDSLEYEIIIVEPGFNAWLQTQRPRGYYSQSFLELKNKFYVTEFNSRVNSSIDWDPNLYSWRIDYNPRIDYGYEVNYLLYHYFLFFEEKYNQNLL